MNTIKSIVMAFALPAVCFAVQAPVVADAHVSAAMPAGNFGMLPQLSAGGGSVALLNFDLATLPAGMNANLIAKASLIIYVNRVMAPGRLVVSPLLGPWSEATVTAASQPAAGSPIGITDVIAQGNSFVRMDITSTVKGWVAAGAGSAVYGLALSADSSAPGSVFVDSKESTSTSQPARIEIAFEATGGTGPQGVKGDTGPAGPQGLQGPQGSQGLQGLQGPKGDRGATGATGPAGPPGPKGDKGDTGPMGLQGPVGARGNTGPQGLKGDPGPMGGVGPQGDQGARGVQGAQGQVGPQGAQGPAGSTEFYWFYWTDDAGGDTTNWYTNTCPVGTTLLSTACGHRDANGASDDIRLNYVGPNFSQPRISRCFFENTSGSSRAIRSGMVCTLAPASVQSADGKSQALTVEDLTPEGLPKDAKLTVITNPDGTESYRWSAPRKKKIVAKISE